MSVELLVAPPASGKTNFCIERIQALHREKPFASVWVIVPDRMQSGAFRRRLAANGGGLNVQVGRFNDLFTDMLERAGRHIPLASMPLVRRLIRDVVDDAIADGRIPYLAPLQPFPGFSLVLHDVFSDLNQAFVTPERLKTYSQTRTPMQKELAVLFADYQERLHRMGWADGNQVPLHAGILLEELPGAAAWIDLLVVDGFDSFNGSQRHMLKLLAGQVKGTLVTLPGSLNSKRRTQQRFQKEIDQLVADLQPQVTELSGKPFLPPPVDLIENHIFEEGQSFEQQSVEKPILMEARSPEEEVRETLRWIKQLVIREDIPLEECAIFTPDPQIYNPLLRDIAAEFGIPIRFSLDEPLEQSPCMSALLNLLELPAINYPARRLLNTLRSPYLDLVPGKETVDSLERISRVARIVEGMDQWQETWDRLERSSEQQMLDLDDERNAPSLPRGSQAAELRDVMDRIFDQLTPPEEDLTQVEWISWLEDLLKKAGFLDKIESEQDQSAYQAFQEMLRAVILSEDVAGDRTLSYKEFFTRLKSMLGGEGYRETKKNYKASLLVGQIQEARGLRFKAVALMGLSEGSFPKTEREDPFLDEELRLELGLEPRLNRDQAGLFYQAITRADERLLITRSYLSDDGEDWEPSAFWKATAGLFNEDAMIRIQSDTDRPLVDAASIQELLFGAMRRKSLPGQFKFLEERWSHLQHAGKILHARRDKKAAGPYEGILAGAAAGLQERYGGDGHWSASGLETYGKCPFFFLVSRTLELEQLEPPELGMDARQVGSMLHHILERAYAEASNPADPESVLASLHEVAAREFSDAPREYGFRPSALWEIEQEQLLLKLENTVALLTGDGWTPTAFEAKFGLEGTPDLLVDIGGETIHLHGLIDRVDKDSTGRIRVIDYKTGGNYSKSDLEKGALLQLPIYALAARDVLGLGTPTNAFYWIINRGEPKLNLRETSTRGSYSVEDAIALMIKNLGISISAVKAAQFPPTPPENGCPSYCPVSQWCWRYEAGWSP